MPSDLINMRNKATSFKEILQQKLHLEAAKESYVPSSFCIQSHYDMNEGPMMSQLYYFLNKKTYFPHLKKTTATIAAHTQKQKAFSQESIKVKAPCFDYSHLSPSVQRAFDFFKLYGESFEQLPSREEIKTSYKRLALKLHPDRHPTEAKSLYNKLFIELRLSYEELSINLHE